MNRVRQVLGEPQVAEPIGARVAAALHRDALAVGAERHALPALGAAQRTERPADLGRGAARGPEAIAVGLDAELGVAAADRDDGRTVALAPHRDAAAVP